MALPRADQDRLRQPISLKPIYGRIEFANGVPVKVDSVALAAEAVVFTPPAVTARDLYEVSFQLSETAGGQGLVTVGIDHGAGGSLAANEQILTTFDVPALWTTEWFGPYLLDGTDTLRAAETGAGTVSIHFFIRKVL